MKKSGNLFLAMGIGTLLLFVAALALHYTQVLVLDTWLMILTGVVLCIGYTVVPNLTKLKSEYTPVGKELYIWILLLVYDLGFMAFMAYNLTRIIVGGK